MADLLVTAVLASTRGNVPDANMLWPVEQALRSTYVPERAPWVTFSRRGALAGNNRRYVDVTGPSERGGPASQDGAFARIWADARLSPRAACSGDFQWWRLIALRRLWRYHAAPERLPR